MKTIDAKKQLITLSEYIDFAKPYLKEGLIHEVGEKRTHLAVWCAARKNLQHYTIDDLAETLMRNKEEFFPLGIIYRSKRQYDNYLPAEVAECLLCDLPEGGAIVKFTHKKYNLFTFYAQIVLAE